MISPAHKKRGATKADTGLRYPGLGPMRTFLGDARWALRSWGTRSWFIGFVFILACASAAAYSNRHTAIFGLPIMLFNLGILGTRRIWYLRSWRGEQFEGRELWSLTRSFFARFLRLGLLCSVSILLPAIVVIGMEAHRQPPGTTPAVPFGLSVFILGVVVILDAALTFVVPALAFSTDSVSDAFGTGLATIKAIWPSCAWYVVTP
jgi:hypothetical protein